MNYQEAFNVLENSYGLPNEVLNMLPKKTRVIIAEGLEDLVSTTLVDPDESKRIREGASKAIERVVYEGESRIFGKTTTGLLEQGFCDESIGFNNSEEYELAGFFKGLSIQMSLIRGINKKPIFRE